MSLAEELNLDMPFSDLRHEAMLNIVHTANQLALAGEALFRRFDLTQAQFNVLFALKYKQIELTQSGLGQRLVVTRATITSVLDKLERKGLVKRKNVPGNRRIYHISLTADGCRLIDRVEPLYREKLHSAMGALTDAECKTLIGYLERVRACTVGLLAET